jgi:hypothetical protein
MMEEDMNCKEIVELLTAYLDGEVTPEEKAHIEAHLPECSKCRAELEALSATQDDLRGMMRLMAEEVSTPDKVWDRVRARLDTKDSWLDGLRRILASKTWQVATVTAAVVVIAVVAAVWQFGGVGQAPPIPEPTPTPTPSPTPPPPMPAPLPALQVSAVPSQNSYLPGEKIDIEFSFSNTDTDELITVTPFPPEIQIMSPRPYEVVRSFAYGEQELKLEPGERMTYNLTWDQLDDNEKQVAPGWYYVDVNEITATRASRMTQWSFGTIAKLLIRYPQGAMEKSIELNQSQTVNGLTITLKHVELTATEARFYAFTIPPGYSPPEQPEPDIPPLPHPPPPEMVPVHAEYAVDGVTKDAGYSGIGSEGDGIRLIWDNLDPVPSDAKDLTFTITRFGDIEGPWEFKVPLE